MFDSIAGSKDGIENLQSLPMFSPIPRTETLYFFLIVKDPTASSGKNRYPSLPAWIATLRGVWWRQTGSNRRPPACKAGALPAELCPRFLVGLAGFEPATPRLSSVCSNQLSYRPGLVCSEPLFPRTTAAAARNFFYLNNR